MAWNQRDREETVGRKLSAQLPLRRRYSVVAWAAGLVTDESRMGDEELRERIENVAGVVPGIQGQRDLLS